MRRGFFAIAWVGSFGLLSPSHIGAAETIGNLSTDHAVTVTSRGLDVNLQSGQDYPVFSGDRIFSHPGEGVSRLAIRDTGNIVLCPDTAISVERLEGNDVLRVERGSAGFELNQGAKMTLIAVDRQTDLSQGTGRGGVSVSSDGREGYLGIVDSSAGIQVRSLRTDALVYQGDAPIELTNAQVCDGALVADGGGFAGTGTSGSPTGMLGAGSIPLLAGAFTAALAVIDTSTSVFRNPESAPDAPPDSPVRP
jgi:hypothetical protein